MEQEEFSTFTIQHSLMTFQEFIFSDKRSDRIKQHLLFWGLWYPYMALTHAASPFGLKEMSYFRNPAYTLTECFFIILAQVPFTYGILYFVLPKFILKKKYVLAAMLMVTFWFLQGILNLFFISDVFPRILAGILEPQYLPRDPRDEGVNFFMAVIATNKGAFTIAASAMMLKFAKHWYQKEHRNLQLQKENTQSQLRLLTAQIHPHFLFNTLNNIYSQVQQESYKGAAMVMELSDLLRYTLYEGRKEAVPLHKEVQMLRDYIHLEKIRYGNQLDVYVRTPENMEEYVIAPLLLLPLIENCFKHGASNILQNPWVHLSMELNEGTLSMKLMNGKMPAKPKPEPSGLGIQNVKQRLELLYRNKYEMTILDDDDVFIVDLKVELSRVSDTDRLKEKEPVKPSSTYA